MQRESSLKELILLEWRFSREQMHEVVNTLTRALHDGAITLSKSASLNTLLVKFSKKSMQGLFGLKRNEGEPAHVLSQENGVYSLEVDVIEGQDLSQSISATLKVNVKAPSSQPDCNMSQSTQFVQQ